MTLSEILLIRGLPIPHKEVFKVAGSDTFLSLASAGVYTETGEGITQWFVVLYYLQSEVGIARLTSADVLYYTRDADDLTLTDTKSLVSPWLTASGLNVRQSLVKWSNEHVKDLLTQWFEQRVQKIL